MVPSKHIRHFQLRRCCSQAPSLRFCSTLTALVACGLVLVVVQQREAFTLAPMPGVKAGPAVVRPSMQQQVAISDRMPVKAVLSQEGNTGSASVFAGLLLFVVGVPRVLQSRALRTLRRRNVGCQGMGSFNVSLPHTAQHGRHSTREFQMITSRSFVLPQASVSTATAALACSISSDASTSCFPREMVLAPAVGENSESTVTIGCTRPAGHLIGGRRRPVRSRRARKSCTSSRAARRQTGARLLPVQHPSVQPLPYDPSRLRMKIQDALRVSTSCVSIAIDSEAKTVAAKSEFSQCTSLYISGNGSYSEDH